MSVWIALAGGGVLSVLFYGLGRRRRAAESAAHTEELERAARARADNVAVLTQLATELSVAQALDSLKETITCRLPPLLGTNDFWVIARVTKWTALVGEPSASGSPLPRGMTLQPAAWECFPLSHRGKSLGLLVFRPEGAFTEERRHMVGAAAALVAAGLHNIRMFNRARNLSTIDSLTRCVTRRHGADALSREMQRMRRSKRTLCVAMLDLDNFKMVNDTYGHLVGDRALATVGRVVRKALRASDIACRYGGEEFMIILPDTALSGAVQAAENLRRRISDARVQAGEETIRICASVGVTEVHLNEEDPSAPVRRADLAMYEAKRAGRDQVVARNGSSSEKSPSLDESALL